MIGKIGRPVSDSMAKWWWGRWRYQVAIGDKGKGDYHARTRDDTAQICSQLSKIQLPEHLCFYAHKSTLYVRECHRLLKVLYTSLIVRTSKAGGPHLLNYIFLHANRRCSGSGLWTNIASALHCVANRVRLFHKYCVNHQQPNSSLSNYSHTKRPYRQHHDEALSRMPTCLIQTKIALAIPSKTSYTREEILTIVAPRMTTMQLITIRAVLRLVENQLPLC
jgi:hypothetical protein